MNGIPAKRGHRDRWTNIDSGMVIKKAVSVKTGDDLSWDQIHAICQVLSLNKSWQYIFRLFPITSSDHVLRQSTYLPEDRHNGKQKRKGPHWLDQGNGSLKN